MWKVLVTDHTFDPLDIEQSVLQPAGATLDARQCKNADQLSELVGDADAVLTQFAPVNARVIAAMKKARVIVRYGIGVDNVDLGAARERGIPVCNVPDYCIDEVADHTIAFTLALTRQVVSNCAFVRGGSWGLAVPFAEMRALRDMVIGVVGFGRIGREVVRRLVPFRCEVRVHDPVAPANDIRLAGATPVPSLGELLATADLVSLHCPSTTQTRRMMNASAFAEMKRGALLVNLARGDLVDSHALLSALQSGQLGGAALDVFDPEPIPVDHPILQLPNVIVAAHVASVSANAVRKLRETAAGLVAMRFRGIPLPNVVNGVTT
jgi:D-3-phosphoglycerate dehydrogenase